MADVKKEVLGIIAAKASLDVAVLDPAAKLTDLNIASLDVVEIVFALEERYDIQIPFNANKARTEFETVGDVIRAVESLVSGKADNR
jgi:acyl carrier protein